MLPRTRSAAALALPSVASILLLSVTTTATGCSKKEDAPLPTTSATALTVSQAPPTAMVVTYDIVKGSKTTLVGPAPGETLKAETTAMEGSLDVDLRNLTNTRGVVKVDLLTLRTKTFDAKTQDEKQTKDAAGWLEVGSAVSPEVREKNRWATFAIRSIAEATPSDVAKAPVAREGNDDVRTVTVKAKGDLLLHQLEAKDKAVTLEVKLHFPAGAAADSKPTSIVIKSKDPLKIAIKDHDVKPRDAAGAIASRAFSLIGTKVAEVLDISLDIQAVPH